jgi:hypothetical protein
MLRVAFLLIVLFAVISLGVFLISRLVVFWRNQLWKWKVEKEEFKKKQLKEAEQEFIKATKIMDETFKDK